MRCNHQATGAMNTIYYKLSGGDKFKVEFAAGNDWEEKKCSVGGGYQRGGERITDLSIELPSFKVTHFMRTQLNDWILTEKTAMLFEEAGFIDCRLKPVTVVKVRMKTETRFRNYGNLLRWVMGERSVWDQGLNCGEWDTRGIKRYTDFRQGLFIDEFQWNGPYFFPSGRYLNI